MDVHHTESGYALVYRHHSVPSCVDVFVPCALLDQIQVVSGSEVLFEGIHSSRSALFYMRPNKGTHVKEVHGKNTFIATIRLPNRPGILNAFLVNAQSIGMRLTSLKTQGRKDSAWSDVLIEGSVARIDNTFDHSLAIADAVETIAQTANGSVIGCHHMSFLSPILGKVLYTAYVVDLPVLRGSYAKIRIPLEDEANIFSQLDYCLPTLIRVQVEPDQMLMTCDLTMLRLQPYLIVLKANSKTCAAPITQALLAAIDAFSAEHTPVSDRADPTVLNVDAIEAYEYYEYNDEDALLTRDPGSSPSLTVAMLLMSSKEWAVDEMQSSLERRFTDSSNLPSIEPPRLSVTSLNDFLRTRSIADVPEDTRVRCFRKILNKGKYIPLEPIGNGTFGVVSKYLNTNTGAIVAGKHVLSRALNLKTELEILTHAKRCQSQQTISIIDYFDDGNYPVIIMDLVEYTLDNFSDDQVVHGSHAKKHCTPADLSAFMEMALQLLRGLSFLHGTCQECDQARQWMHADVKPSNIGFNIDNGRVVWKLLDFGVSKRLALGKTTKETRSIWGTKRYMSPQAIIGVKHRNNDLFSLGVVLFTVLCGCRHPGTLQRGAKVKEVDDYVEYLLLLRSGAHAQEPAGFNDLKWQPKDRYVKNQSQEMIGKLKTVIFGMMDMAQERRYQSAEEVIRALRSN